MRLPLILSLSQFFLAPCVCVCVRVLEDCPLTNAGVGSSLTSDGRVECDVSTRKLTGMMDAARLTDCSLIGTRSFLALRRVSCPVAHLTSATRHAMQRLAVCRACAIRLQRHMPSGSSGSKASHSDACHPCQRRGRQAQGMPSQKRLREWQSSSCRPLFVSTPCAGCWLVAARVSLPCAMQLTHKRCL